MPVQVGSSEVRRHCGHGSLAFGLLVEELPGVCSVEATNAHRGDELWIEVSQVHTMLGARLGFKAVYSCFGIFFISRPSCLDANHRPLEDEKRRAAHRPIPGNEHRQAVQVTGGRGRVRLGKLCITPGQVCYRRR